MSKIKMRLGDKDPIKMTVKNAVLELTPPLEDITITPSKEEQVFNHPNSYGYDNVTVNPATKDIDSNIKPENIKTDVEILGVKGTYAGDTSDATATPEDIAKGKTAYISSGKVTGAMKNVFTENFSTGYGKQIYKQIAYLPNFDFGDKTTLEYFCDNMTELLEIAEWDTSKIQRIIYAWRGCSKLKKIPKLNAGSMTNVSNAFSSTPEFEDFGGLEDLGKAYYASANYSQHSLYLTQSPKLTHESLMNVINNLYDLNLSYDVANGGTLYTQTLGLGSTNLAKLTADEINIAVSKGWSVS